MRHFQILIKVVSARDTSESKISKIMHFSDKVGKRKLWPLGAMSIYGL
jgi:hypothetical protein